MRLTGNARRAVCTAVVALGATASVAEAAQRPDVTIRRTTHGIPHIVGSDYFSAGYGVGYSVATDNICALAEDYVTVDGERSRYFGPDGDYDALVDRLTNLNSDFFFSKVNAQHTVERLVAEPPPNGPMPEVRGLAEGYVAGYNRYLFEVGGAKGVTDPACKGQPWVRPITTLEFWRRIHKIGLFGSSMVAVNGIATAAPALGRTGQAATDKQAAALRDTRALRRLDHPLGDLGSNAIAIGGDATANHRGLLLANPHFPWTGDLRMYEQHITVPGKLDVAGAGLVGIPFVVIGFNRDLAWTHTVSTSRRFLPYQLTLVPGDPHSYIVDGKVKHMTATTVTVQAKQANGTLTPITRTLYDTEYGPMFTSLQGHALFPWTALTGYALYDANADNIGRGSNEFVAKNRASSVAELDQIDRRYQAMPFINTFAVDRGGDAYYNDIGAVPNFDQAKQANCSVALGLLLDTLARVQVADGSRGACAPGAAAGAARPGLLPPSKQPSLLRKDYVENSNDSYWLTNPRQPLTGYPRIVGDERTARGVRTRIGLKMIEERLNGSDGLGPAGTFNAAQLINTVFANRNYLGELWRDPLVQMCGQDPMLNGTNGVVDGTQACAVLAAWDLHDTIASRGALLFRRFATQLIDSSSGPPWAVPFNPADPINTPRGLNTLDPSVQRALAGAIADLRNAGIPLDASLGDYQYATRGRERIPVGGGPDQLGVFNVVSHGWNHIWDAHRGYPDVTFGSSYIQTVQVSGGCPDAQSLLTFSQSEDPTSPFYADQTQRFSNNQLATYPFCRRDVDARTISVRDFGGGVGGLELRMSSRVIGGRLKVTVRTSDLSSVRLRVERRGRRALTKTVTRIRAGNTVTVSFGRLARGRLRIRATASSGQRTAQASRVVTR